VTRRESQPIQASAPGPTSGLLTSAVEQATRVGRHHRYLPLTVGLVGTVVTATMAMGQLERAMNRIYGIERDRPFAEKYKRALLLALSAGVVIATAFGLLAFGRGLVDEGVLRSFWLRARSRSRRASRASSSRAYGVSDRR
jgi:uncharacterized BrkB/YihY/UPF0761 family membrane protein